MRRIFFAFAGVVVILAIFFVSGCAPKPSKSPEEMMKSAVKNWLNLNASQGELTVNGDVKMKALAGEASQLKFDFKGAGGNDQIDPKNLKMMISIVAGGSTDIQKERLGGKAELRLVGGNFYANMTELSNLSSLMPPDAAQGFMSFSNKWWKFPMPEESIKGLFFQGDEKNLTAEQKKVREQILKTNFFKSVAYQGVEEVKGMKSFRYTVTLDNEAFVTVMAETSGGATAADIAKEKAELKESLKGVAVSGDVWVSQSDEVFTRALLKITSGPQGPQDGIESLVVDVDYLAWDFNKPVMAEAPSGAQVFDPSLLFGIPVKE